MFTLNDPQHGPIVLMPVPLAHAPAVAEYLASLTGDNLDLLPRTLRSIVPAHDSTDEDTDPVTDALPSTSNAALSDLQWTPERLATFAASEAVSVQRFVAALDVLAVDSSRKYGTAELAKEAGLAYSAFKHATTRMNSHLAKHYGVEAWPMTATWNDVREEVDWSITETVAARWREIRGL
jgi:hypothetical protein